MDKWQEIVTFWVHEVGPQGWYNGSEDLDQQIRDKFQADWDAANAGKYDAWACCPEKALALVILLDQFPRNMFRGDARSFATDKKAKAVATNAIRKGFDLRTPEPQRQFFYMPLMHSECLTDQERCVRMLASRMPESGQANLLHALVHREIIRDFGRFPYRNGALLRETTPSEADFVKNGGYAQILKTFEGTAMAKSA